MRTHRHIEVQMSSELHLHEVTKVVDDLIAQQAYSLAFEICERYIGRFDDGYLYHRYLTLPAKMGNWQKTVALLEEAVQQDRWLSAWFIERFNLFEAFRTEPTFTTLLTRL